MNRRLLLQILAICALTITPSVTSFDCDNTIFDDSDIYECDSGECILRGFRCDGDPDCADGSDEGASNCGDIIAGAVIGGLAGITIFFICPCVIVGVCFWYHTKRRAHVLQPTTIIPTSSSAYQPYVPPNTTTNTYTTLPTTQVYNPPPLVVPTAPSGGQDAPPPYPLADFTASPGYPPAAPIELHDVGGGQTVPDYKDNKY